MTWDRTIKINEDAIPDTVTLSKYQWVALWSYINHYRNIPVMIGNIVIPNEQGIKAADVRRLEDLIRILIAEPGEVEVESI